MRADLLKSASLAYEAETFIVYLSQARSTENFALGHLDSYKFR